MVQKKALWDIFTNKSFQFANSSQKSVMNCFNHPGYLFREGIGATASEGEPSGLDAKPNMLDSGSSHSRKMSSGPAQPSLQCHPLSRQ
jgi:hypothetical protein